MNRFETKYSNSARAMDEALIYLLNDKDYDYITIKEICKKAGVNRSTFYLHYENIDDLLKESVDWMINDFFSYFDNIKANLPRDMKTKTTNELFLISKTYLIPYLISYGSFVTIIISCGTIISSLLSSRLLARFGTGFICIFSTALTAIALLLFSFSNNFYLLCVCALPLGLGAGAIDIALNNYVALHYSAIHMSFLHCFYGVGVSASPYILSKIIGSQGNWRIGYQTAASIQFAILLLLIATITLWSKTKISVSSASVRHGSSLSFRTIVRMPGVKEICCMFITSCGIEYTCGNWCSTFLVENKNMPIANAAQVVMLYYIGLTLGRFCSGLLAVRLHSWKIIRLGQIVLGAGILLLFMPFLTTSVIGFFLIGFGNGPLFPNLNYLTPENFGENISQNIMGIQMAASYLGIMLAPAVFGILGQWIGVWLLPLFLICFYFVMLASHSRAKHFLQSNS